MKGTSTQRLRTRRIPHQWLGRLGPDLSGIGWQVALVLRLPDHLDTACSLMKRLPDLQQHPFAVLAPLMVPKPHFLDSLGFEKSLSTQVALPLAWQTVPKAVQFDRQPGHWAIKVQKVASPVMLTSEFEPGEPACSQCLPELPFFFGLSAAQNSGCSYRIHSWNHSQPAKPSQYSPSPLPSGPKGRGVHPLVSVHGPALRQETCRFALDCAKCNARVRCFSLSPSEGERARERGPFSRLPPFPDPLLLRRRGRPLAREGAKRVAGAVGRRGLSKATASCRTPSASRGALRAAKRPSLERLDSWFQCMRRDESGFSMNRRPRQGPPLPDPLLLRRRGRWPSVRMLQTGASHRSLHS